MSIQNKIDFSGNHLVHSPERNLEEELARAEHEAEVDSRVTEMSFQLLNSDCIFQISCFLSWRDILSFEQVEKVMSTGIHTQRYWKAINQCLKIDFIWSDAEDYEELQQDKIGYLAYKTLCKIEKLIPISQESMNQAGNNNCQLFGPWTRRFPSLQSYVHNNIKAVSGVIEPTLFNGFEEKSLKPNQFLLEGLYHLNQFLAGKPVIESSPSSVSVCPDSKQKAEKYLTAAIQQGATVASLFAVSLLKRIHVEVDGELHHFFYGLAELSITTHHGKDYRGLQEYLLNLHTEDDSVIDDIFAKCKDQASCPPPIFESLASRFYRELDWQRGDQLSYLAIEKYGKNILPQTWENLFFSTLSATGEIVERDRKKQKTKEYLATYKSALTKTLFYGKQALTMCKNDAEAYFLFLNKGLNKLKPNMIATAHKAEVI